MYEKSQKKSEEILKMYQEGKKLTEICKETISSQPTVKKILFSYGLDYDKIEKQKYLEKLDLAVKMYEEGKSQTYIEEQLNLTRKTIRNLLKDKATHYKTKSEQWRIRYGSTLKEDAFETITPESAYWLGMLYSDGHIGGDDARGYNVELGLHSDDIEHLKKYQDFLECNGNLSPASKQDYIRVKIGCQRLHQSLKDLGFTNQKSYDAKPHESVENNRDFWRGCVDGDGGIYNRKDNCKQIFICGTLDTVIGFIVFCENNSEIINRKFPTKSGTIYQVSYYGKEAELVADLLYKDATVYLDRKYKVYKNWIK